jgi:hypothetical protein
MKNLLWVTDQSLEGDSGYGLYVEELRDRGVTVKGMEFSPRVLAKLTLSKYDALLFDIVSHAKGQRLDHELDNRIRGVIGLAMMTKRICVRNRRVTRIITGPVDSGYGLDNSMSVAETCAEEPFCLLYVQARDIYGSPVNSREFVDNIQRLL